MQSILDVRWKLNNKGKSLLKADCSNVIDQANVASNADPAIANADLNAERATPAQATTQQIPEPQKELIPAQAVEKADSTTIVTEKNIVTENVASKTPTIQASEVQANTPTENPKQEKESASAQEPTVVNCTTLGSNIESAMASSTSNTVASASNFPQNKAFALNAQNSNIPQAVPSAPVTGSNAPFDEIPLPDDEFYQADSSADNTVVANSMANNLAPANEAHSQQQRAPNNEEITSRTNWHLRKKRADIYIEDDASVPYLAGLKGFLKSKGISLLPFNLELHYLPYDLILLNKVHYKNEGTCAFLDDGKASIWAFLQQHFKGKL